MVKISYLNEFNSIMTLNGSFPFPAGDFSENENRITYKSDSFSFESMISEHSSGIMTREDKITNISDKELSIYAAFSKFTFFGGEYEVYTQRTERCYESIGMWQELNSQVCVQNSDSRVNTAASPFLALYNRQTGRGLVFHIMTECMWSISVKKNGVYKYVTVELGLDPSNLHIRLQPNESFLLPKILFYEFKNKADLDSYKLHRYCNELYPAKHLPIIYNSWMSNFDVISYDYLCTQLERAAQIGCDYFVIDAGWFGPPMKWSSSTGDWRECETDSMRGRMKEFSDKVREYGLKFGIWFEPERASVNSESYKAHPEYYVYEQGNAYLNFALPDACDYIFKLVSDNIDKYGLKFIKLDANGVFSYDESHTAFTDYYKGYRKFIDKLRKKHPDLYIERCAGGGLNLALCNLPFYNSYWVSDNQSLISQLGIFKDTIMRLPPRALEKWITVRSLENFLPVYCQNEASEKILMSADSVWERLEEISESYLKASAVGGPIGISCDLTRFSDSLMSTMTDFIAKYKQDSYFWSQSECRILTDTETMLVLQFNDKNFDEIRVFIFAKNPFQTHITVYPVTDSVSSYTDIDGVTLSAEKLNSGIDVKIGKLLTAEDFTLKKAK